MDVDVPVAVVVVVAPAGGVGSSSQLQRSGESIKQNSLPTPDSDHRWLE